MKRNFMHFASFPARKEVANVTEKTVEDYAYEIEEQLQEILKNGQGSAVLNIDLPEDLSDEEAMKFIDAIMKRLDELNDMDDDE